MPPIPHQPDNPVPPFGPAKLDGSRRRGLVGKVLSALSGWQTIPAVVIALYIFLGIFGPALAPFEPNRGTFNERLCPPLAIDALTIAQHPRPSGDCMLRQLFGHRSRR